jgi:virginiamycin B lyase
MSMHKRLATRATEAAWLAALLSSLLVACSSTGTPPSAVPPTVLPASTGSTLPSPAAMPSATARPSPSEHAASVTTSIPLDVSARDAHIALGFDSIWMRFVDGTVARIDPVTKAVLKIPVGHGEFGSLAVGEGAVWVTTFDEDKVSRIDPATNRVAAEIAVGTNPEGIAVTPGAVWISNHRGGSISRIDPATNTVVATITFGKTGPSGPKGIEISHGSLWTSVPNMGFVVRIDPATNKVVATIKVTAVEDLVIGSEAVYAFGFGGKLYEIDAATNEVVRKFVPNTAPWVYESDAFWTSDGSNLLRLDSDAFTPTDVWRVPGEQTGYSAVAFDDGAIWLLTDIPSLIRVELAT